MKTTNVIIVCVTAIICTALLAFAAIKRSHHRWHKGTECCAKGGHHGFKGGDHEFGREGGKWGGEGRHGFGEGRGHFGKDFDPKEMAEHQTEFMKEKLSLTDDQTKKVEVINLKYAEKRKEIMQGVKGQMETMHTEKVKELSTVLDKDQLAKVEQFKKRWEQGGEHHPMMQEEEKDQK